MLKVQRRLCGWGRTASAVATVCIPDSVEEVCEAIVTAGEAPVLAVGAGRSYGDAGVASSGLAISTERLNKVLSFDRRSAEIVCEAGVTYQSLLEAYVGDGYVVPVTPGTGHVTLGGAIANDVHGKNHDSAGSVGAHVNWIELICADGTLIRASRTDNVEVFNATIGGIGLTGVIVRASITMKNLEADSVVVSERRVENLDQFIEGLKEVRGSATYSVGWIDALCGGKNRGRGILETAESSGRFLRKKPRRAARLRFDFPHFAINKSSVQIFNAAYFHRIPGRGRQRVVAYDRFVYPLDAVGDWNRMYGKQGFYQFQCVLPEETSAKGIREILRAVSESGNASFLAVLKTLGSGSGGYLSFPMPGFTLALDIPSRAGSVDLLRRLEGMTLQHGGRVYLAKDSVLSKEGFKAMYPDYRQFLRVRKRLDASSKFQSDMARRLELN